MKTIKDQTPVKSIKDLTLVKESDSVEVLGDIKVPQRFFNRLTLGVPILDEMFGGAELPGILPGTSFLFTGSPGAGKSTMGLQLADYFQRKGHSVLYNMGEENKHMVKLRADRIGLKQEFCIGQFQQVDRLVKYCEENGVEVLFQDSIQSLRDSELDGPKMLKSVVKKLQNLSKEHDLTMFLIGHITKGGQFAGPQEIKHDVDAHAHLQLAESGNRIIELQKNRFGPASVPYEFALSAAGLDFQQLSSATVDVREGGGSSKASQRKEAITKIVRDALLAGERVSGYCFERLKADCSGGFWRMAVMKVCQQLGEEGYEVIEAKISGRTHSFLKSTKKGA